MRKIAAVHLTITQDCNFKCVYCFAPHRPRYMSETTMRKALEFLLNPEICEKNINIEFFGGEPLLNIDILLNAADYGKELAKKNGVELGLGVVSNMSLMTDNVINELKSRNIGLLASYDGIHTHDKTRQTGTTILVAERIQAAIKAGLRVAVATQVVPGYIHELYENVVGLERLGVTNFALNPVTHFYRKWTQSDFAELETQMELISNLIYEKKINKEQFAWGQLERHLNAVHRIATGNPARTDNDWSCGACKGSLGIDVEGYITPCQQMPTGCGFDEWILGHVAGSIDNTKRAKFLETKFEECVDCAVQVCAPCRTVNKTVTGSEFEICEDSCTYQRILWTAAIKLHNRLADTNHYKTNNVCNTAKARIYSE